MAAGLKGNILMKVERIELHHITQQLVHPFRTSFGVELERPCILVALYSQGLVGWGECVASIDPGYSYETTNTAWHILSDFLIPPMLGQKITSPWDVTAHFSKVRGHPLAKASLENAVWDLMGRARGLPLAKMLGGGQRDRVEVGVSIGIQPTLEDLLERVDQFVDKGYGRIKMKIEPGWEIKPLSAVRERYPAIKLMADANSAFSLDHVSLFQEMDALKLLMIEQPLHYLDFTGHAYVRKTVKVPVILDESVISPEAMFQIAKLEAADRIVLKINRVGGFWYALKIISICEAVSIGMSLDTMPFTKLGDTALCHLGAVIRRSIATFACRISQ